MRFKKIYAKPNITLDYHSIDQYKDAQFINGKITINSKEFINKVSKNETIDDVYI
jgi:hypothetical protein